jgi:hypothetical protein
MKRKGADVGVGVVTGEEEASCPGVAAAEPFNFLSDLPDLVLRALIDFLQPGDGVPPTSGTFSSLCGAR